MLMEIVTRPWEGGEALGDAATEATVETSLEHEITRASYVPCVVSVETLRKLGVATTAATRDHLRYGHSVAEFTD